MAGDSALFTRLYRDEKGRLSRLVGRLVRNGGTAEELVQDAFTRLLSGGRLQGLRQPEAYLARAARNLALNHLRHQRQGVEVTLDAAVYQAIADGRASPEMEALYRQELRRLLTALLGLPPRRREIFILHRFQDLTYDQIAARLGIARNTVMVQIVNALADLHRALESGAGEAR